MKQNTTSTERIKEYVINNAAGTNNFQIDESTLLFEEGLFDSMGFMALIAFLQEEYNIQANDDELVVENFESINAIVTYVNKKLSA
ncbi:MAG: acyl carrier protein [Bacteroidales bacterium]|nr:acyl carrier protein [Bacteroidales bacterium]MBN2757327.1 acyl carrier protein [Bacteroidales bacterium]